MDCFAQNIDCSQSPYFSVGFSRLVRFNGAAAILVCKSERDLGRVSIKTTEGRGAELGDRFSNESSLTSVQITSLLKPFSIHIIPRAIHWV